MFGGELRCAVLIKPGNKSLNLCSLLTPNQLYNCSNFAIRQHVNHISASRIIFVRVLFYFTAYRDAQSFRFSHYFICSLSECTLLLSGIATYTHTKAGDDSSTTNPQTGNNSSTTSPLTGELLSHITVSQPLNIEVRGTYIV